MLLGLEFTDDVDPTALATAALALLTVVALWFTWRSLKQTKQEIRLSRDEVEQAHRPVLVPVLDNTRAMSLPDAQTRPAVPVVPGNRIYVPVENIGAGPALDVEMGITLTAQQLPDAYAGEHTIKAPGIGIGHLTTLEQPLAGASSFAGTTAGFLSSPFDLRLTYLDVAGKRWLTTARFHVGMANSYQGLDIKPLPAQDERRRLRDRFRHRR
jgi:hypothetical protein